MLLQILRAEKGIALVTTLALMMLAFATVAFIISASVQGTKMAGLEQRYVGLRGAARGGSDYLVNMLRDEAATLPPNPLFNATWGSSGPDCFQQKMNSATSTANWSRCSANASTPNPREDPDLQLRLRDTSIAMGQDAPGWPIYDLFLKIIDTRDGATDRYYTIMIRAEVPGTQEHLDVSILYRRAK
jgi:hypothetical protein